MTAAFDLQATIFAALKANGALSGEGGRAVRVYDDVPDAVLAATAPDSEFPYVQIGETDALPDDASTSAGTGDDGEVETVTLHVWSRYQGQKEVKNIMQQIKSLLHNQALTVSGRASALAYVRSRRNFTDPDGRTRHGVVSVEVIHRS